MSADEPRRRRLSDEERVLWGRATRSVAPLSGKPARPSSPEKTPSPAKSTAGPRVAVPARSAAPPAKPRALPSLEPLDRVLKRRLARGTVEIDGRLDLHGKTQSEAHAALLRFLAKAQADRMKFALVITGKGVRGEGRERGVLRRQVPLWLSLPEFRAYVAGFEDAHVGHGGEGALYVRIRARRGSQT
jgi:DNA-nicking Smr family endonuclease